MNAQTPGSAVFDALPLAACAGSVRANTDAKSTVLATVPRHVKGATDDEANGRLLAAAYTAFDQAGRALGVDAATLAASVDLAALIRAAREAVTEPSPDTPALLALARLLAKLPTP